tara:strand:+ start:2711 stop:3172 length:462 start_codon:yes stop_codon:yes gene_type:complete
MEYNMNKIKFLVFSICIFISGNVLSAEHVVKMLSNLKGQSMVFEPPVLTINPGDSVKWVATNPGHNTASIDGMLPQGANPWNGGINEELVVKFDKEGVYGYKCTPHYILGMAGFIVVGNANSNLEAVKKVANDAQSKFAMNKTRLSDYLEQVK